MVVTWTYDAPSNTATASGSGTTNFAALIAADAAGPWNKFVADSTGSQIVCAAKIIIAKRRYVSGYWKTNTAPQRRHDGQ